MGAVMERKLEDIENLYCGTVFPNPRMFSDCKTALCIFSAEWLGIQDAYWIAKAGLIGECVDLKGHLLDEMRELYPKDWQFHERDAYEFAEEAVEDGRQWDVLTLDPWCGQFDRCANLMEMWTTLARKVVILGHGYYRLAEPEPPLGWNLEQKIFRTDFRGGVYWYCMVKA